MKSLLLAITFAISSVAMASTPATVAVNDFLPNGEYTGLSGSSKCSVKITSTDSAVSIFVANINDSLGFTMVDSSTNYSVNDINGKISASQKLNAPYYLQGASQVLSISGKNDQSLVMFSISIIAMDHRGEDMSTSATCTITK